MYEPTVVSSSRLLLFLIFLLIFLPCTVSTQPLSLDEAVRSAVRHSGQIEIREWELREKRYALEEAKAERYPVIGFQAAATLMTNPQEGVFIRKGEFGYQPSFDSEAPMPFPDQDYVLLEDYENTYFTVETALDQPIFTWGKLKRGIELARGEVRSALVEVKVTEEDVKKQVIQAYFGVQFARQARQLMREAETLLSKMASDRATEYQEGVINLQTLLETERNRAAVETRLAELEQAATQAENGFFLLTGIHPNNRQFSTPLNSSLELPGDPYIIAGATVSHSPEVRRLSVTADQADNFSELEGKTGQLRPDFFLRLGMDVTGQRIPLVGANWTDTWDINFLITIGTQLTVWDAGRSEAKRKGAAARARIAREGLRQTINSTRVAIEIAAESQILTYRQVKESETLLALSREQYKNAEVSYENDLITRGEVLGAEAEVLSAEIELLSNLLNYQHARAELAYLTGGTF